MVFYFNKFIFCENSAEEHCPSSYDLAAVGCMLYMTEINFLHKYMAV